MRKREDWNGKREGGGESDFASVNDGVRKKEREKGIASKDIVYA